MILTVEELKKKDITCLQNQIKPLKTIIHQNILVP